MNKSDLMWLAGFMDADGSIALWRHKDATHKKGYKIYPSIIFTNNNPFIIENIIRILDENELQLHVVERNHTSENHARTWQVASQTADTVYKVLTLIEPYLVGKKPQAKLVLRFLNSRRSKGKTGSGIPYSEEEIRMAEVGMTMNKRGVSKILTDYTQDTIGKWKYKKRISQYGDDIVGSSAKSEEQYRNDTATYNDLRREALSE